MNLKILIVVCLSIVVISLGCVNAADNNTKSSEFSDDFIEIYHGDVAHGDVFIIAHNQTGVCYTVYKYWAGGSWGTLSMELMVNPDGSPYTVETPFLKERKESIIHELEEHEKTMN